MALIMSPVTGSAQEITPDGVADRDPVIDIVGVSGALADNIRLHVGVPDERCSASQRRLNRLIPGLRDSVR